MTWLRIAEQVTQAVTGNYVWKDPAADDPDALCVDQEVIHIKHPVLNVTGAVIEFTMKEVSG